jgi:preprotein translocase subunit SecG
MIKALTWIELIISIALIASIMLQHRGTGLGGAFAGEANVYRSKRGIEKFLFNSTIVLAILLVAGVIVHLYLKLKAVA